MQITIDGKKISFTKGETILEIARRNGIEIPTLCFHPMLEPEGRCRVCLVEANARIVTSCDTRAAEGMIINTKTKRLLRLRREAVNLIASSVPPQTLKEDNELTRAMKKVGLRKPTYLHHVVQEKDHSSKAVWRRTDSCILCGRCTQLCSEKQSVDAIAFANRGEETVIVGVEEEPLASTKCVSCGQCVLACPTNALTEAGEIRQVERILENKEKIKVVQVAPSVRVSLGECFGLEPGAILTGQVVAALKKTGFDYVFDTNFSADMTIMEEATELVERIKNKKTPMFTSCCPAWIDFCCEFYPKLVSKLSTTKSPQQVMGAMIKTYFAKKRGIKPKSIVSVSIMPCTAKKREASLSGINASRGRDIDLVLTTRELAELLKKKRINPTALKPADFDSPLGESTGAGTIFGSTGGVMEAALRTAYFLTEGHNLRNSDLMMARGSKGIREFSLKTKKLNLKGAVAHGLGNARKLIERMIAGEHFDFVEVMACPGGCVGGGGQPKPTDWQKINARAKAIYRIDRGKKKRASHENEEVKKAYFEFLGEPCSKKAERILHRHYPVNGKKPSEKRSLQDFKAPKLH